MDCCAEAGVAPGKQSAASRTKVSALAKNSRERPESTGHGNWREFVIMGCSVQILDTGRPRAFYMHVDPRPRGSWFCGSHELCLYRPPDDGGAIKYNSGGGGR